ncbi:MAG: undecaprenyldiphospho-muramoylpentapeptide beta-N-acetylglucosaminyltransferase [Rickettsiales bacterium]|nr:undecaprenyldiphospho-muramoylpentapeptide beta-N-acetylglucosaminyltransferase [Rickettsiales bacterium]
MKPVKIWIATGGTGGHIFPAIAVANELARRGNKIIISSDGRGMPTVRRNAGFKTAWIWASGVGAKSKIQQVWSLIKIAASAAALTLRFAFARPARVIAFGGYASVPVILAAHVWKIPTILHEQNAAIGRANAFSLRWVKKLLTSFPTVGGIPAGFKNTVFTGLPVRDDFTSLLPPKPHKEFNLLITGGSLGAQILDTVMPDAIKLLKNKKIFITHQTRPENVARLQKLYSDAGIKNNVLSFIRDMAGEINNSDLIIGRSGASTVVEIQTVGRPAIFVPLAVNPDQLANAESFAKTGGGIVIKQPEFTPKRIAGELDDLMANAKLLEKMRKAAKQPNDATKQIADEVLK